MPISTRFSRRMFLSIAALGVGTLVSGTNAQEVAAEHPTPGTCLTAEEASLAQLVNSYRADNGLPAIPVSKSLTTVAQWHVIDLQTNKPNSGTDSRGLSCNMHSWSDKGNWSPVCYTSDHKYAGGMWSKPQEITGYKSEGYEIAYGGGGTATPQGALAGWKSSTAHNAVILNKDIWTDMTWQAMGVGIQGGYAVVWFDTLTDPQGTLTSCGTTNAPSDPPRTSPTQRTFLPRVRRK